MKELIIIINYEETTYQYTIGSDLYVCKEKYTNGGTLHMFNYLKEGNNFALNVSYDNFENAKEYYDKILCAIQDSKKVITIYNDSIVNN